MADDTLAVILAGGRGQRLEPLTHDRAKPAVPFGGAYRIIDFTLSNCLNSKLKKILLLTQFKSMSLDRHISLGWQRLFNRELGEYLDPVPPQQRLLLPALAESPVSMPRDDGTCYKGTADAVYQNIYAIEKERPEFVIVLAGDHIYKMDYQGMIDDHIASGAELTIGVLRVPIQTADQFGVMRVGENNRAVAFIEKPQNPETLVEDPGFCLASMGIYVFRARFLFETLLEDANSPTSSHDFGKDIVPSLVDRGLVNAHLFDERGMGQAYWRDVGTLDAYYEANMDLVAVEPKLNMYDHGWPIRSYQPTLPPPKFVFRGDRDALRCGEALDSIVCAGCIVSGARAEGSILGPEVRLNSYSHVQDSILFDGVKVGRHAKIRRAIIEKNVVIPREMRIGYDADEDRKHGFTVTDSGLVVVPKPENLTPDLSDLKEEQDRD
jgi:glucose-1-phosphate adenylyltransferase